MAKLHERLREFNVDCVYNVDETGVHYKLLPKRSYVNQKEDRKNAPRNSTNVLEGPNNGICCTNADGSKMVLLATFGKAKYVRCFRLVRPLVHYFNNGTA